MLQPETVIWHCNNISQYSYFYCIFDQINKWSLAEHKRFVKNIYFLITYSKLLASNVYSG